MNQEWTADQVWAAAVKACRTNQNEYLRNDEWIIQDRNLNQAVLGRKANKFLMLEALRNLNQLDDCDYKDGQQARQHFQKFYTFRSLKGNLNGFEARLVQTLTMEQFTENHGTEFSVIASQIPRWQNHIAEQEILADAKTNPLGTVGERMSRKVIVARVNWSEKYQIHYITARTECDHVVFFGYKNPLTVGEQYSIQGTVKAHRVDSTQLNRVKVFDL